MPARNNMSLHASAFRGTLPRVLLHEVLGPNELSSRKTRVVYYWMLTVANTYRLLPLVRVTQCRFKKEV